MTSPPLPSRLVLGAVPGAAPDKWVRRWRQRYPDIPIEVQYYNDAGALDRVEVGTVDITYLRIRAGDPAPAKDLFHSVLIYSEEAVVCASREHWVAAAEESVQWAEIAEEPLIDPARMGVPATDPHTALSGGDLAAAEGTAVEVAAAGTGLVLLPNSLARALSRKDVVVRSVTDQPGYEVYLVWLRQSDSEAIQDFIGIARGRKESSGRSQLPTMRQPKPPGGRGGPGQQRSRPQPQSPRARPPRGRRRPR